MPRYSAAQMGSRALWTEKTRSRLFDPLYGTFAGESVDEVFPLT